MTVKIDGTNTEANPAFTGADTDTGLQCGTNEVKLVTGGTARVTVNSSGRLSSEGTSQLTHQYTGASNPVLFGQYNSSGDASINNQANAPLLFATNNTERMRILSDGTIRLASGCPGIDFSQIQTNASGMTSETLDSYERGTWTPSGIDNFNGITSAEGQYEKIGNLVNVVFQFNYSSLDSSTSSSGISGLPFTVYDFNSLTGVEATNVCFGTNKHVLVYANSGSTNLYFDTAKPLYGSTSTGADFFRANLTYLAG